jgi:hypothetical protein
MIGHVWPFQLNNGATANTRSTVSSARYTGPYLFVRTLALFAGNNISHLSLDLGLSRVAITEIGDASFPNTSIGWTRLFDKISRSGVVTGSIVLNGLEVPLANPSIVVLPLLLPVFVGDAGFLTLTLYNNDPGPVAAEVTGCVILAEGVTDDEITCLLGGK